MAKKVAVRKASLFLPADIPNLALHVAADSGVYVDAGTTPATDGQRVQQWNDTSGASNHVTQATADNRPTYRATGFNGQPGVDFTPPSYYRIWATTPEFLGATYDTAAALFWIGAQAGASNRIAISTNTTAFAGGEYAEWNRFDVDNLGIPTSVYHGAQTLAGNIRCVGMSYDGTTLRTIINGHLIKRARTGNLGLSGAALLGNYSAIAGSEWTGCIGEALVYRYGASDTDMRRMCTYLLTRWGLTAPSPRKVVCYVGDSQTAFAGVQKWPGMVADVMGTTSQSHTTVAQPGVDLAYINSIAAGWVDPVCDETAACNVNLIWAGTNDLAQGVSGATVYSRLETYCAARRAAGWDKIVVLTALPRSNTGCDPDHETLRQAFNSLVRANYASIADAIIDVAADGRIGDDGDELDTTYYDADKVHLNSTGQAVIAALAQPVIAGVL